MILVHYNEKPEEVEEFINFDLNNINEYMILNKLMINWNKTKAMTFSNTNNTMIQLKCNKHIIENVKEFTYLGLIIDNKLNFKSHINKVIKKLNSINSMMHSLKNILPTFILIKLYYSLAYRT